MTTTRHEAERGLLYFLVDCEALGKKPTRSFYRRWRDSDAPNALYGMVPTSTTLIKHYGSWDEALRQVAPVYKELQEELARHPDPIHEERIAKSIGPRRAAKPDEWWP